MSKEQRDRLLGIKPEKFLDLATNTTYITNITDELYERFETAFCNELDGFFGETFELEDHEEPDLNIFNMENFIYKYNNKSIGSGAWIKVPTEIGYNVYWAKPIAPRRDSFSLERELSRVRLSKADDIDKLNAKAEKLENIRKTLEFYEFIEHIGIKPYYVQIKVARNKYKYLLPTQYELVSDVDLYQNVMLAEGKDMGVTFKELYKSNDEDIIFYIMSRGIPKEEAVMMAKLKEIYFIIDVQMMMHKVIRPCES